MPRGATCDECGKFFQDGFHQIIAISVNGGIEQKTIDMTLCNEDHALFLARLQTPIAEWVKNPELRPIIEKALGALKVAEAMAPAPTPGQTEAPVEDDADLPVTAPVSGAPPAPEAPKGPQAPAPEEPENIVEVEEGANDPKGADGSGSVPGTPPKSE